MASTQIISAPPTLLARPSSPVINFSSSPSALIGSTGPFKVFRVFIIDWFNWAQILSKCSTGLLSKTVTQWWWSGQRSEDSNLDLFTVLCLPNCQLSGQPPSAQIIVGHQLTILGHQLTAEKKKLTTADLTAVQRQTQASLNICSLT